MPLPEIITAAHKQGIGEVVATWALLETQIIKILQNVLDTEISKAAIIFWHMSHKERMIRLQALVYNSVPNANDPIRREFDTLYKRIDTAYQMRNAVAHSLWTKGKEAAAISPFIFQAKGDIKFTGRGIPEVEFTPERLNKEAQKIDRLFLDIRDFFSQHELE